MGGVFVMPPLPLFGNGSIYQPSEELLQQSIHPETTGNAQE